MAVTIVLVPTAALSTSILDDTEIAAAAAMLQDWVNKVVAPAWSQGAYKVTSVKMGAPVPVASDHLWLFWIADKSDVAGAGGYHSLDANGNPFARIFAGDALRMGFSWTVVLAHEAAEAMIDRFVDSCVLAPYQSGDAAYFVEVGDPFEAGPAASHTYRGRTWQVANVALPSFYKPWHPGPYDLLGLGTAPLHPTPGGRQTILPLSGQTVTIDHTGAAVPADPDDVPPRIHVSKPKAGGGV